jgi:hypothetical protein
MQSKLILSEMVDELCGVRDPQRKPFYWEKDSLMS